MTIRDWEPRTATSTFTQFLSSDRRYFILCCFSSTKTIRLIRDGEPRTATSTFTQLSLSLSLSSSETVTAIKNGSLGRQPDFHTDPELSCVSSHCLLSFVP